MHALPNLRPRLAQPPPAPEFRMPRERRRGWGGAAVSLVIHASIVALALWPARALLQSGGSGFGPGPEGGGGGGGRDVTHGFVALQPPAQPAPPAQAEPEPPEIAVQQIPLPEVMSLEDLARLEVPTGATVAVAGAGPGGGPGSGPGTGGGRGSGDGPGVGSGTGPGSGGDGSYLIRAQPRGVVLPPQCVPRGVRFQVQFWVAASGQVTAIDIQPLPRDESCRRDFEGRMRGYRFEPARTRDGVAVASVFTIIIGRD